MAGGAAPTSVRHDRVGAHERAAGGRIDRAGLGYAEAKQERESGRELLHALTHDDQLGSTKRTPGRARPPLSATGEPSARQQAAPVMLPSSWNWMAFMPPATVGITCTLWPRS